jgi:hypothetical protein
VTVSLPRKQRNRATVGACEQSGTVSSGVATSVARRPATSSTEAQYSTNVALGVALEGQRAQPLGVLGGPGVAVLVVVPATQRELRETVPGAHQVAADILDAAGSDRGTPRPGWSGRTRSSARRRPAA